MNDENHLWYGCVEPEMRPTRGSLVLTAIVDALFDATAGMCRLIRSMRQLVREISGTAVRPRIT
jgi:hypothetical protein